MYHNAGRLFYLFASKLVTDFHSLNIKVSIRACGYGPLTKQLISALTYWRKLGQQVDGKASSFAIKSGQ